MVVIINMIFLKKIIIDMMSLQIYKTLNTRFIFSKIKLNLPRLFQSKEIYSILIKLAIKIS